MCPTPNTLHYAHTPNKSGIRGRPNSILRDGYTFRAAHTLIGQCNVIARCFFFCALNVTRSLVSAVWGKSIGPVAVCAARNGGLFFPATRRRMNFLRMPIGIYIPPRWVVFFCRCCSRVSVVRNSAAKSAHLWKLLRRKGRFFLFRAGSFLFRRY